mgnify:CR=1 FL=1
MVEPEVVEVALVQMAFEKSQGVAVEIFLVVEVVEALFTSYLDDLSILDCKCLRMDHALADFGFESPRHGHFPILHSLSIKDIAEMGVLVWCTRHIYLLFALWIYQQPVTQEQ